MSEIKKGSYGTPFLFNEQVSNYLSFSKVDLYDFIFYEIKCTNKHQVHQIFFEKYYCIRKKNFYLLPIIFLVFICSFRRLHRINFPIPIISYKECEPYCSGKSHQVGLHYY